jgi:cyclophilin family peptidyl-prolyl cis-trans isomerase
MNKKLWMTAALLLSLGMNVQAEGEELVKVKIETTMGEIQADLYAKEAPKTVENFVKLAKQGFYDGIIFHRVIPDFMIQTGDPTGTGMGGPGYKFEDEFSPNLKHDKAGVLSMANSGPNTNGSQFFITDTATPWLDKRHSVFGQVTQGIDVVKKIATAPRDSGDKPKTEIKMIKVTVL